MNSRALSAKLLITLTIALLCSSHRSGPDSGPFWDRMEAMCAALAYDPHNPDRIFLGTSTGVVFVSNNGGQNWSRFAHPRRR